MIDKYKKHLTRYQNIIKKHSKNVWLPDGKIRYKKIKTSSWYDTKIYKKQNDKQFKINNIFRKKKKEQLRKCMIVNIHPTRKQKRILQRWFSAYVIMYNKTLKYIKDTYKKTKVLNVNFRDIRTNALKDIKKKIANKSIIKNNKNTKIHIHTLDTAIKLACSNYKSALTNLRNGNIKHFRIRYKKHLNTNKILELEKEQFKKKSICYSIFNKVKTTYNNKPFDLGRIEKEFKVGCKILYNSKLDKYYLLIPVKINEEEIKQDKEYISLDPGMRTFLTGITEDEIVKIGNNVTSKLKGYLEKLDQTSKIDNLEKQKRKQVKYRTKIKNVVDDLHWKTINYLTKKHKTVLIGDMSIKRIVKKKMNDISKMTKRVGLSLKFFVFKQRLEYKCKIYNCNYKEIDESFTSKVCSNCSSIDDKLGSKKVYNCSNCFVKMDRDINGCRGILLKTKM